MKKKFSVVFLVALMIASLFISCDNGIKTTDPVSKVLFTDSESLGRGLNSVSPEFDKNTLVWMYEAKKTDNSGLKTGETSKITLIGEDGKLSNVIGPFSLGEWQFKLYAYEKVTEGVGENLKYAGTVNNVIIRDVDTNTVNVKVSALQNGNGSIEVLPTITLHDANGNPVQNYDELITIESVADPSITNTYKNNVERVFSVNSGAWKVTVAYVSKDNAEIIYGKNSIYVTVFDNQTVTVGGSLEEITADTKFETTADGGIKVPSQNSTVHEKVATILEVKSSPAAQKPNEDGSFANEAKTLVTVPADVLAAGQTAQVELVTYDPDVVADKFIVTADKAPVAGLDLNLNVNGAAVKNFAKPVSVVTYISKNLTSAVVEGDAAAEAAGLDVVYNGGDVQPTVVSYDPATGKLEFTTSHFSEFYVVSDCELLNVTKNIAYKKFSDIGYLNPGFDTVENGEHLLLLKDACVEPSQGFDDLYIMRSLSIDLNNHVLTSKSAMVPYGEFRIGNGTINSVNNSIIKPNNAHVIIESGSYNIKSTDSKPIAIVMGSLGTTDDVPFILDILSGEFNAENAVIIQTHGNDCYGKNEINIQDGTFNGALGYFPGNGIHNIYGGTFTNEGNSIYLKCGELNIHGGKFTNTAKVENGGWYHNGSGSSDTVATISIEACDYPSGVPHVSIDGGEFSSSVAGMDHYDVFVLDCKDKNSSPRKNYYRTIVRDISIPFRYAEVEQGKEYLFNSETTSVVDVSWYDERGNYSINTAAELAGLAKLVAEGVSFKDDVITLVNDIDLVGYNWKPIGTIYRKGHAAWDDITVKHDLQTRYVPIDDPALRYTYVTLLGSKHEIFQGTFDGADHQIKNLNVKVDEGDKTVAGLFGVVGDGAVIKNVTVNGEVFNSQDAAAGIAGMTIGNVEFNKCINNAIINKQPTSAAHVGGSAAAGIVARVYQNRNIDPSIKTPDTCIVKLVDCENNAEVYGKNGKSGGLIGYIDNYYTVGDVKHSVNAEITNCKNTGNITNFSGWAGGFVGELSNKLTVDGGSIAGTIAGKEVNAIVGHLDDKDATHPSDLIEKVRPTVTVTPSLEK